MTNFRSNFKQILLPAIFREIQEYLRFAESGIPGTSLVHLLYQEIVFVVCEPAPQFLWKGLYY